MMTKKTKDELALEALDAYMAGLNEKKLKISDNQILSIQLREANGWKEKNERRRKEDPDYDKRVGNKISQAYSTPEMKQVQASKARPHREETKEHIRQIQLVRPPRTVETRKKMSKKKIGNNNRAKPIVTPIGIFVSKTFASEVYLANGKMNAMKWIEKWIKEDPLNFYYITKEEYIMLTGKDI